MGFPSPLRLCAALLLAVPLAGCGEESGPGGDPDGAASTTPASTEPSNVEGTWLLRLTAVSPEHEGEAQVAHYVRVTPSTGAVEDVAGDTFPESATGRESTLLVDAARKWALSASLPGYDDRGPELINLTDGSRKPLSPGLTDPVAWSFDPTGPGKLRYVQGDGTISVVDVESGRTTPDGELVRTDDEYGYSFDADTGAPYVVSLSGGANRPAGLGDPPANPVGHDDGQLVFSDKALPAGACPFSAGFEDAEGATTAFCVTGQRLTVFTRGAGDSAYTKVGEPVRLGFVASGIDFALPPTD